jgi:hypothetical protein
MTGDRIIPPLAPLPASEQPVREGEIATNVSCREWTIYPSGFENRFALGFPDGRLLREGELVELFLDGSWHAGWIEYGLHSEARFVSYGDKSACGLCATMKIRLPVLQLRSDRK